MRLKSPGTLLGKLDAGAMLTMKSESRGVRSVSLGGLWLVGVTLNSTRYTCSYLLVGLTLCGVLSL